MPLVEGHSRDAIGENIRRLHIGDGRPLNQSVAIALRLAHQSAAKHRAAGGYNPPSPSLEEREYLRDEDSRPFSGGLINSAIPGRTDRHNIDVPSGSYVLPADVVSGLGEGNTMAGAAVVQKMFGTAPYGVPLAHNGGGGDSFGRMPSPPAPFRQPAAPPVTFAAGGMPRLAGAPMPAAAPGVARMSMPSVPTRMPGNPVTARIMRPVQPPMKTPSFYRGGAAGPPMAQSFAMGGGADEGHKNGWVPIVAAGGEIVLPPSIVKDHPKLGRGSLSRGHAVLDHWVKLRREKTIAQLKKLPGPAK